MRKGGFGSLHSERHGMKAQSGVLRASVFGINDGLVSNLSLVMGVAGAQFEPKYILVAGFAGLLAGAFSMAAGEFISMRVQREVFEKLIAVEEKELKTLPEEELLELQNIYESKGVPTEQAVVIASALMANDKMALETHLREELGLNPNELGSPLNAALGSFLSFVVGAIMPVLPYVFLGGKMAFIVSIILSALALLTVGIILSLITRKNWFFSGLRMLLIGGAAAAVTYMISYFFGVSMSG